MEVFGKFRKINDILEFHGHKRNTSQSEDSKHHSSEINEKKESEDEYKTRVDQGTSPLHFKEIRRIVKKRKKRRANRTFSSIRKKSFNSVIAKHDPEVTSKLDEYLDIYL
jgi:polyribonucleotide nucleotidyltransferase